MKKACDCKGGYAGDIGSYQKHIEDDLEMLDGLVDELTQNIKSIHLDVKLLRKDFKRLNARCEKHGKV